MKRTHKLMMFLVLLFVCLPESLAQMPGRYRVAACDWMMLKRQKLGEFALARQIGADGVELDMGPLGKRLLFENALREDAVAVRFRHTADSMDVAVPSVAMSGFFAQNLVKRTNYRDLMNDCLATMKVFGSKVAFLPLGGSGKEWKQKGPQRDSMVAILHDMGEMACASGVRIGIRTGEDAKFDKRLLKDIGSAGVGIYFNFQDAADGGRDICKELKRLGRKRIVQIHASNTDAVNLPDDPEIDLPAIKRTLDRMGWSGWLVVERSRDAKHVRDVKYNFGRNVAYLKQVFQGEKLK